MNKKKLIIGSRGSQLALQQANWVKSELEKAYPDLEVSIKKIQTKGDKIQDVALAKVGGKGLFVKEIEDALLENQIDIAVHSMKDVPTELPKPLFLAAITKRVDPRDVFISKENIGFDKIKDDAVIGTSSMRRQSQLLRIKPNLKIVSLRGNLDTRLRKVQTENMDGIIVAAAGLNRMGWTDRITEHLSLEYSLPAVGQGALGIEARRGDDDILAYIKMFDHPETNSAVSAERAFLKTLDGGCQVPIAAFGEVRDNLLTLEGFVGSVDGKRSFREKDQGEINDPETLGIRLAERLKSLGAGEILKEIYGYEL